MGVCSYCNKFAPQWEECFSWQEAKACSGVEPKRDKKPNARDKDGAAKRQRQ
jgi:hypothetical protein